MNMLIQFLMKLFGMGGSSMVEKLIKDALLGGKGASGGKNPLEDLMGQFKDKGLGNIVNSWIGTGKNEPITPAQIADGIGPEKMNQLSEKAKVPPADLAQLLAKYLPGVVDKMTPTGKIG